MNAAGERGPIAGVHAARRAGGHASARRLRVAAREVAGRRSHDHAHGDDSRTGLQRPLPDQTVIMGEVPGRSGLLAIQPPSAERRES